LGNLDQELDQELLPNGAISDYDSLDRF